MNPVRSWNLMSHKNAPGQGTLLYTVMKKMGGTDLFLSDLYSFYTLYKHKPKLLYLNIYIFLDLKKQTKKEKGESHFTCLGGVIVNHI